MSYWDKNPNIFKILISIIAIIFMVIVVFNFNQNISPSDENRFVDIQNRIITKNQIDYLNNKTNQLDTIFPQTVFYILMANLLRTSSQLLIILIALSHCKISYWFICIQV